MNEAPTRKIILIYYQFGRRLSRYVVAQLVRSPFDLSNFAGSDDVILAGVFRLIVSHHAWRDVRRAITVHRTKIRHIVFSHHLVVVGPELPKLRIAIQHLRNGVAKQVSEIGWAHQP